MSPLAGSSKQPQSSQLHPVSGVAVTVNGEVTSVVVGALTMTPPSPEHSPPHSSLNVSLPADEELPSADELDPSSLDDEPLEEPSPLVDEPSLDDDVSPAHACPDPNAITPTQPIPTIQRMPAVYSRRADRPTDALGWVGVAKKQQPETIDRDFAFASDRELDDMIAAFRSAHETTTGQRLAMHARRSLGAGKVRITFRIVEAPARKKS